MEDIDVELPRTWDHPAGGTPKDASSPQVRHGPPENEMCDIMLLSFARTFSFKRAPPHFVVAFGHGCTAYYSKHIDYRKS